ncbi:hypothetical protein D3C76_1819990 [compost metagenome]
MTSTIGNAPASTIAIVPTVIMPSEKGAMSGTSSQPVSVLTAIATSPIRDNKVIPLPNILNNLTV